MEEAMSVRTLAWAANTLGGIEGLVRGCALAGREEARWYGATVDTRKECSGRLFFAFSGEHTRGHLFATEAIARGAVAVVLEDEGTAKGIERSGNPCITVKDTLEALQHLARAYRDVLDVSVVAITGSSGKTTTKEYTRSILKKKYRVHGSPESFNSRIGVPLTILETDEVNEYLVSEVGANRSGEIDLLAAMLRPDIGVITNIGEAHIGLFGSRDNIAAAKSELLAHVRPSGYAVLPGDDEYLSLLVERAQCRSFTFGFSEACNYRITDAEPRPERTEFSFNEARMSIRASGMHNVSNAAASLAVGDLCGVDVESSREGLLEMEPLAGRGKVVERGGMKIIDDSYNANPNSMRASLDALMGFEGDRKFAVLGDMKELGDHTESCHRDMGAYLAKMELRKIFWVGEFGEHVEKGYHGSGGAAPVAVFPSADRLAGEVAGEFHAGDIVLVKGSRACKLEKVVEAIRSAVESGKDH
jgi:UDP-N-acetylmuramoyl-tripeptide--D-alanyl-D-alanine ligase